MQNSAHRIESFHASVHRKRNRHHCSESPERPKIVWKASRRPVPLPRGSGEIFWEEGRSDRPRSLCHEKALPRSSVHEICDVTTFCRGGQLRITPTARSLFFGTLCTPYSRLYTPACNNGTSYPSIYTLRRGTCSIGPVAIKAQGPR